MEVEVGQAYKIGPDGATVQLATGAQRTLPPDRYFEFGQPGTVVEGSLSPAPEGVRLVRRTRYYDKSRRARRDYQDKSR